MSISPFSRARFGYFEYAPSDVTFSEPVAQYFLDVLTDASLRATFPLRFHQLTQLPASGEGAFSDAAAASPIKTRTTKPKSETSQQNQPTTHILDISRDSIEVPEPEDTEHHTHDLPRANQETLSSTQDVSKTPAGPTEHPDIEATLDSEFEVSISVRDPLSSSAAQNCNFESLLPQQVADSNAVGTARSSKRESQGQRARGPRPKSQAPRKRRSDPKTTSRTRPAQSSLRKTRKLVPRLPPHTRTGIYKAAASVRAVKIEPAFLASVTQELHPIASSASTPSTATAPATTHSPMPATTAAPASVPPRKRHLLLATSAPTSDQTPTLEHASTVLISAAGTPAPASSEIVESEALEGRIDGGATLAKRPNLTENSSLLNGSVFKGIVLDESRAKMKATVCHFLFDL